VSKFNTFCEKLLVEMPHISAQNEEKAFEILIDFRLENIKDDPTPGNAAEKVANTLFEVVEEALKELQNHPLALTLALEDAVIKKTLAAKILASLESVDEVGELLPEE